MVMFGHLASILPHGKVWGSPAYLSKVQLVFSPRSSDVVVLGTWRKPVESKKRLEVPTLTATAKAKGVKSPAQTAKQLCSSMARI